MACNLQERIRDQVSKGLPVLAGLPAHTLLFRGILAGVYIGMGTALMIAVSTGIEPILGAGFAQFVMGAVFPLGLILIVLTGAELFTGGILMTPLSVAGGILSFSSLLRIWGLVLFGNAAGAVFFAALVTYGVLLQGGPDGMLYVNKIGVTTVSLAAERFMYPGIPGFFSSFLKSLACGWLLAVGMLFPLCSDDLLGKIAGVWFCGCAIAATGLEHLVTNFYLIPAGLFTAGYLDPFQVAAIGPQAGLIGYGDMLITFIPVFCGNIVGGLFFGFFLLTLINRQRSKDL